MPCIRSVTSASHACFHTLLISAVFALRAIARRDDAATVVFTTERHTVTGIAQKERLQTNTANIDKLRLYQTLSVAFSYHFCCENKSH